ncbi:MAG: alpha/beta hydrolase, partial [Clostridia bacterium]|nr:alpha/beta hydrolase [Clostridia bacterium]
FDGTVLQCYLWNDVKNAKGVVQISHGMAEHARRYDNFAQFLNKNGFIVFADDHRAHGQTSTKQSAKGVKGYHKGDIYNDTVKDEVAITKYLKEKFGLPVVYLGHSYGSMVGQRYLQVDEDANGYILSGSAMMKGMLLNMGAAISNMQYSMLGGEKRGDLLNTMSFGSYNKPFKKEDKTGFGWLSRDKEQVKKYALDDQCGYTMSIAFFKFFLNGLKSSYKDENLAKVDKSKPIAIFSGDKDPVGGNGKLVGKLYDMYKGLGVNATIKLYPDARHEILNEINNQEVYADFLEAINSMI